MEDARSSLNELIKRCQGDPRVALVERETGDELARAAGDDLAFAWDVAVLRAVMAAPPDGDAVRETYGALVDRHRDAPARMAILRPLGDEIRRLEQIGELPSTLVARSSRRKR